MAPSKNIKVGPQKSPPPPPKPAGQKLAPTPARPDTAPVMAGK